MTQLNTIDEAIEILQALKEGKEIEYLVQVGQYAQPSGGGGTLPNFKFCKYRVKPQPREYWIGEYLDRGEWKFWYVLRTKASADLFVEKYKNSGMQCRVIRVAEQPNEKE